MAEVARTILVLCKDLLFISRITAEARAAGVGCVVVREPAKLSEQAGSKLIVDLNLAGAIDAGSAWQKAHPESQIVGFVSHVDTQSIAQAKAAGLGVILPRSQFVAKLPQILGSADLA